MTSNVDDIRRRLDEQRRLVRELEAELAVAERGEQAWIPEQFYTAYYILSGLLIGMGAAWITLILNAFGSYVIHGDPVKLMAVYGTFFAGDQSLGTNDAATLMLSVGIHTLTGAICGAPIHVVVSRFFPSLNVFARFALGVVLGVIMWAVNFYGILSWLQPALVGKAYILEEVPMWLAIANHVAFAVLVLLMQPIGSFQRRGSAAA